MGVGATTAVDVQDDGGTSRRQKSSSTTRRTCLSLAPPSLGRLLSSSVFSSSLAQRYSHFRPFSRTSRARCERKRAYRNHGKVHQFCRGCATRPFFLALPPHNFIGWLLPYNSLLAISSIGCVDDSRSHQPSQSSQSSQANLSDYLNSLILCLADDIEHYTRPR
jgi:hypothetical protein